MKAFFTELKHFGYTMFAPLLFSGLLFALPISRGQHLAPVAAFTLVVALRRARASVPLVLIIFAFFCALCVLITQAFYTQTEYQNLYTHWLGMERGVYFTIFFFFFYRFYPHHFASYGALCSISAVLLLLEPYGLQLVAFAVGIDSFKYFDFVMSNAEFLEIQSSAIESLDEGGVNGEIGKNYQQALEISKNYLAPLNSLISVLYFFLILRAVGKRFLAHSFTFVCFSLPSWLLYGLLAAWAILLGLEMTHLTESFLMLWRLCIGVIIVSLFLYCLQGLAIAWFYLLRLKNLGTKDAGSTEGERQKAWLLITLGALAILIPIFILSGTLIPLAVLLILVSMGVLDVWFDYRRLTVKNSLKTD